MLDDADGGGINSNITFHSPVFVTNEIADSPVKVNAKYELCRKIKFCIQRDASNHT